MWLCVGMATILGMVVGRFGFFSCCGLDTFLSMIEYLHYFFSYATIGFIKLRDELAVVFSDATMNYGLDLTTSRLTAMLIGSVLCMILYGLLNSASLSL